MKKSIAYLAMFIAGAVIGSGATYILTNEKLSQEYKKRTEEEIDSVKARFAKMQKEIFERNEAKKAEIMEQWKAEGLSETLGYSNNESPVTDSKPLDNKVQEVKDILNNASNNAKPLNNEPRSIDNDIYIITQEQFGENDDYELTDLTYYPDGFLTDNVGDVIEDPAVLLGETVFNLLGTYSNAGFTETYVRNDINRIDYEIDFAEYNFLNS